MASDPSACFDPVSFIFTSPFPALSIPPNIDMVSFLFSLTSARSFHHRVALANSSSGESLTFLQLHRQIGIAERTFSFLGIGQHDVVLILSPNSLHFPVLFFAILSLGAIATTANPINTPNDIINQVRDSNAKLIVAVPEVAHKLHRSGLPILIIGGGGDDESMQPPAHTKLLSVAMKEAINHVPPHVKIHQTDTAAILYTSGTTGASKGAMISHRNFIAQALQVGFGDHDYIGGLTFLAVAPMFHIFGLSTILFAQLCAGNMIIVMPRYDLLQMLKAVETYRITHLYLARPIMVALAHRHDAIRNYDLSSVKEVLCGGAHVGEETMEEVCRRLNNVHGKRGYGMTEAAGRIAATVLQQNGGKSASVGPLVSGVEALVVDPRSGRRLLPNKQGELWVRAPNIMQGYLNNKEATNLVLDEDGWLRTGDLVYFDSKGCLFIVGRLKELIKYKAFQVAPVELEALLMNHSEIMDAAVIPFPDEYAGEVPLACIVRAAGSTLTELDVIHFVEAQVAPYKKIRKVKFVENLPKTASGKLLRHTLVQQVMRSKL